ncbi:MAG TPA: hypothetical protein VHL59_13965, partial [Thermoanaerobaculia bacterium]|nr:hypothetical protein [Thermoanaerobaculia bacterium]
IWSSSAIAHESHAKLVRWSDGTRELATVLVPENRHDDPRFVFTLSFLDPRTGEPLRTRRLPATMHYFPEFSNRWGVQRLDVTDLNNDGADEVLVTYGHMFYPSFIMLHDLGRDESRLLFVARGHHSIRAVEDLDGDRHEDLVIAGIANKMGWNTAVAAVRVRLDRSWDRRWPVSTPDMEVPVEKGALLWYALTPPGTLHERVTVDAARRVIRIPYLTRPSVEIPFAYQSREREEAYARLREVARLTNNNAYEPALQSIEEARALAAKAGDAVLGEWVERVAATTLVQAGWIDDGEQLFTTIHVKAFSPADVAHDAATAFHRAGALPRAAKWYRVGLTGNPAVGRIKYEYVLGLVLALCEMKQSAEALRAIESFVGMGSDHGDLARWFRSYVAWRDGGAIPALPTAPQDIDFMRYWWIEFALARNVPPKRLLQIIDVEESRTSEFGVLLDTARAEALHRAGRHGEALKFARSAFQLSLGKLRTDILVRAHFDLVAERYARIAERQGLLDDAASARRTAAAVRWRANGMTGGMDALSRRALPE